MFLMTRCSRFIKYVIVTFNLLTYFHIILSILNIIIDPCKDIDATEFDTTVHAGLEATSDSFKSSDNELSMLKGQNKYLKKVAMGSFILSLLLSMSVIGMAIGYVEREKSYENSLEDALDLAREHESNDMDIGLGDFVWTKLGLEQIPFKHWKEFSEESEASLYIKGFPFPGENFTDAHFSAWKVYVEDGARMQNLLDSGYILSGIEHQKAKEAFDAYSKIPSTYADPIVIKETLIDYRLQFATDIGSTMIEETAAGGRLVSPAGRRLREHFYRFPDQCDATPIALEVFLRLMM